MSNYLSADEVEGLGSAIATLESDRRSSESTFLGTLAAGGTGVGYTGAGITSARAIAATLNVRTPGPLGSAATWEKYRNLVIRCSKITGG